MCNSPFLLCFLWEYLEKAPLVGIKREKYDLARNRAGSRYRIGTLLSSECCCKNE